MKFCILQTAMFAAIQLTKYGGTRRGTDPVSLEVDTLIKMESGGELGAKTVKKLFVDAYLENPEKYDAYFAKPEDRLTDALVVKNPLTRKQFTTKDEAQVFAIRKSERLNGLQPPATFSSWKDTEEARQMIVAQQEQKVLGDAERSRWMNEPAEAAQQNMDEEDARWYYDVDIQDVLFYTNALYFNSSRGNAEVIRRMLLANPWIDVNAQDGEALRLASENGHADVVKLLLARDNIDVNARDGAALRKASENGHTDVVKLLLAHPSIDVNAGRAALRLATEEGHSEVIALLLDYLEHTRSTRTQLSDQ